MTIFFSVVSFILGLGIGSFLNVVVLRLPQDEKITGRSHCPSCKHELSPLDLVPLFSYLGLRGRCRYCGTKISSRYAIIEATVGILFLLSYLMVAPTNSLGLVLLLRSWFIISILLAVFVIDLEHYLILDKIIFPATITLLIFSLALDALAKTSVFSLHSFVGGGVVAALIASGFFGLLWLSSRGRIIGFGDVKYGLFLGLASLWPGILFTLFSSFVIGSIVAIPLLLLGKKNMKSAVAFGTFLSLACLLNLFVGHAVIGWYLGLLGWS